MPPHQGASEPRRTARRFPDGLTAEEAFARHDAWTRAFSEALAAGRCRPSRRFEGPGLSHAAGVLAPLTGAWSLEILFALHVHGAQRFADLKRRLEGVSSRVLTDKLRHLAAEGFVARAEEGAAVSYALTPDGSLVARHLHPIVFHLRRGAR
ncbi:MAG TPA: helix-turn-helix domain-containing protein [Candidatus Thermoplasmatota archaeon]|nr:helix-turn-helix domain-containing protein [Candidatus Thermoplasmatota archaeon]